jgi:tetratricopeptide (TPR) repeat protein
MDTKKRPRTARWLIALLLTAASPALADDWIRGQVVDAKTGQPVANAWVGCPDTGDLQKTDGAGLFGVKGRFMVTRKKSAGLFRMVLLGDLSSSRASLVDKSDKPLFVRAAGYKPFYGRVSVVAADVSKGMVVVNRIGVGPEGSEVPSCQAGEHENSRAEPFGKVVDLTVEPRVAAAKGGQIAVRLTIDAPAGLPFDQKVYALLSDGSRLELPLERSEAGALTRSYGGRLKVPQQADVYELTVGSVVSERLSQVKEGFFNHFVLTSLVRAARGGPAAVLRLKRGQLLAETRQLVVAATGASPQETALWDKLARQAGKKESPQAEASSDQALELISHAGDGRVEQFYRARVQLAAAEEGPALRTALSHLGDPLLKTTDNAPALLLRDWATGRCALAAATEDASDREAARESLVVSSKQLRGSPVALRQLANAAFVVGEYGLAADWYAQSAKALGDLDRTLSNVALSGGPSVTQTGFRSSPLLDALSFGAGTDKWTLSAERSGDGLAAAAKAMEAAEKTRGASDWLQAAVALQEAGLLEQAEQAVRESLKANASAEAWNLLGTTLYRLGKNPDEELEAYQKATELDPGLDSAWYNLGFTFWESGRRQEAVTPLTKCANRNDDEHRKQFRAAELARGWQEAQSDREQAAAAALMFLLDDSEAVPGESFERTAATLKGARPLPEDALPQELATALDLAQRAATAKDNPWACWVSGRVAAATGEWDQAAEHFAAASRLSPDEPLFPAEQADAALARGDLSGAAKWGQSALARRKSKLLPPKLPGGKREKGSWVAGCLDVLQRERERRLQFAQAAVEFAKRLH